MKIKVSEATNTQLDWLVAKALGLNVIQTKNGIPFTASYPKIGGAPFAPSTDWAQGGPIIKRECITLQSPTDQLTMFWVASSGQNQHRQFNHDPLIAAMRCYCCSKLGDEVDIPEELCQSQNS